MSRGEVWWAEHPEWGRRPALVMTREQAINSLNEVFVVLATTRIRGIPTEVELGHEDGMPRDCILNADHTDTIRQGLSGRANHRTLARKGRCCMQRTEHRDRLRSGRVSRWSLRRPALKPLLVELPNQKPRRFRGLSCAPRFLCAPSQTGHGSGLTPDSGAHSHSPPLSWRADGGSLRSRLVPIGPTPPFIDEAACGKCALREAIRTFSTQMTLS